MSLNEAYRLAHTAECRLEMEASRPDRNLRFLVGHLLHYENLRLRIVEIEHDVSKSANSKSLSFRGANDSSVKSPSAARKSPPPPSDQPVAQYDPYEDDEVDDDDPWSGGSDEDDDQDLGLQRFPSGSAQPPRHTAPHDSSSKQSTAADPTPPDPDVLQKTINSADDPALASLYEGVRKCPCHGHTDAPSFSRVWDLPPDAASTTAGEQPMRRVVAEVSG